jgi:glycosyltransferase involved in cell wall biosynthesis
MNIIYAHVTDSEGGASVHVNSFIAACRRQGHGVTEVASFVPPYRGDKAQWSIWKKAATRLRWFTDNFRYAWRIQCEIRLHRPDAVVMRFDAMHRLFLAVLVARMMRPLVLEVNAVRSIERSGGSKPATDHLDAVCFRLKPGIFTVSERMKDHMIATYGLAADAVEVIENGVDPELFNPAVSGREIRTKLGLEDRYVLGFIGSFKPWHGVGHLVEIGNVLNDRIPNLAVLLVGSGGAQETYRDQIRQRGLEDVFVFAGHVEHGEIPKYLAAMDVLMSPHAKEGFIGEFHGSPLKIFEYMAMGKPIVAAPLGQIGTIIEDGISGYLIPSEDTAAVANVVCSLFAEPELSARLGRNAVERVRDCYTWDVNARRVIELCESKIG